MHGPVIVLCKYRRLNAKQTDAGSIVRQPKRKATSFKQTELNNLFPTPSFSHAKFMEDKYSFTTVLGFHLETNL